MPAVTAAIPTYNRAGFVAEALESVLAQTYTDYEVVVIDNGSTDDTRAVLEPYLDRIRYVYQENQGRAGARNRAIELAQGRYVAFLDSDDVWFADKLERQVRVLEERPAVGLVHGHVEVIDDEGRSLDRETAVHRRLWSEAHRNGASYAGYALECRCFTSTIMVRAACLARVGSYDRSLVLEDLDLYLRIALDSELVFLEGAPLARYRLHAAQTTSDELTRGMIEVCHKHLALLDSRPAVPDAGRARRNFYLSLATCHHILCEQAETRRFTLEAARVDPLVLARPRVVRRLALSFLPRRALRYLRGLRRPRAGLA